MARITTLAIDTHSGRPAVGLRVRIFLRRGQVSHFIRELKTNAEGRTDSPLIVGDQLSLGVYEMLFAVSEYFKQVDKQLEAQAGPLPAHGPVPPPPFLGEVVVRFGVGEPSGNYHIALVFSKFGYSAYLAS